MSDEVKTETTTTAEAAAGGGDAKTTEPKATDVTSMMGKPATKVDAKPASGEIKKAEPYAIAVPEQYAKLVDKESLKKFEALANELGVTAEQANKIAAMDFERRAAEVKSQFDMVEKQSQDWFASIKADKELGGDNLQATKANLDRFFAEFGDDAMRAELKALGMENHPGLVRMFSRVAEKFLNEDRGTIGGGGPGKQTPTEEQMLANFYAT